jgi:uncharacterized protein
MNRPIHFEILADDPEALAEFYGGVFGWKTRDWRGPVSYWMVTTGEDEPGIDGAFMQRHFAQGVINTISVESHDRAVERVLEAGGEQVQGPHRIPGVGLHSYCADPEGNLFGILEPEVQAAAG